MSQINEYSDLCKVWVEGGPALNKIVGSSGLETDGKMTNLGRVGGAILKLQVCGL